MGLISTHGMPLKVEKSNEETPDTKQAEDDWADAESHEKVSQSDVEALLGDFGF